ncbi:NUDIX hydrolase [Dactylosporangium sp. CA-233914]|uniref:NUDIX hydrolase n=1 Tax=Dactylosporangium sp. CA-233914 TaxID=3239934 RepID=UPI003D8F3AD0
MTVPAAARDNETMSTVSGDQRWLVSWHPAGPAPSGRNHGAAGICIGHDGRDLVLISHDQIHWGFPAGRPEGGESLQATLAREMYEEACVDVLDARLLGFARSECTQGHEQGLVLVRSYWLAHVVIGQWEPRYEIAHRRIVPAAQATRHVRDPDPIATRIAMRALVEARLSEQNRDINQK